MIEEVFIVDVLKSVVSAMQVANPTGGLFTINYEPGRNDQILDHLKSLDKASLSQYKYPLIAAVMPIQEQYGSGFTEVTVPKIVIAYLTKDEKGVEFVLDKYVSNGIFKTILRPCKNELINRIAWSTYTNMGDPDAYEYTYREIQSQSVIGEGLNDFVDIIEILNLKITIFSQIKTCN